VAAMIRPSQFDLDRGGHRGWKRGEFGRQRSNAWASEIMAGAKRDTLIDDMEQLAISKRTIMTI
jgi:hypothetical protein